MTACRKQTPAVLEKVKFFGGMAVVVFGFGIIGRWGSLVGGALAVWLGTPILVERKNLVRRAAMMTIAP